MLTQKGTIARYLQIGVGDAVMSDKRGRCWTAEIKTERRHTGKLFLETISNKNLTSKTAHAERGTTMGWLWTCRADALLYYFLDTDDLYVIGMFRLKRWAFGVADSPGHIYRYDERQQRAYSQPNDTFGRIVPINALAQFKWFRHCKVRQLALFEEDAE